MAGDDGAEQDYEHDEHAGEVLGLAVAEREAAARAQPRQGEGDTERYRRRGVAKVVDRVRQQRHASGEEDDHQLQDCRDHETRKRPLYGPESPLGRRDRRVHRAVGVAVTSVRVVTVVRHEAAGVSCKVYPASSTAALKRSSPTLPSS